MPGEHYATCRAGPLDHVDHVVDPHSEIDIVVGLICESGESDGSGRVSELFQAIADRIEHGAVEPGARHEKKVRH